MPRFAMRSADRRHVGVEERLASAILRMAMVKTYEMSFRETRENLPSRFGGNTKAGSEQRQCRGLPDFTLQADTSFNSSIPW